MRTTGIFAIAAAATLAACAKTDDAQRLTSRGTDGAPIFVERDASGGTSGHGARAEARARGASGDHETPAARGGGDAEAARPQRDAELQSQQDPQQPQGAARAHEVSGRVVTASDRELVLRRDDGVKPDLRLRIGPGATITIAGKTARATDLAEGTAVRASYQAPDGAEGAPTAIRIVGQPEGTATGAPHGSSGGAENAAAQGGGNRR